MSRITFEHRAPEGEVFGPDAFRDQVGTQVPFRIEGFEPVQATMVAVGIAQDGKSAIITLEVPHFTPVTVLAPEGSLEP